MKPTETPAKSWTKADVLQLLATNDAACERAILTLFERQTRDEQSTEQTRHKNAGGFSASDAHVFSGLANFILNSRKPVGQRLSPKQLSKIVRETKRYGSMRIGRYADQLLDEIERKGGQVNRADATKRPARKDANTEWADHKRQFAELERQSEEAAFAAKMAAALRTPRPYEVAA